MGTVVVAVEAVDNRPAFSVHKNRTVGKGVGSEPYFDSLSTLLSMALIPGRLSITPQHK